MADKHLFMFGGGAPFNENLAEKFASLASNGSNKVVILFLEQEGWQQYMPKYTDLLEQNGVAHFINFILSHSPSAEFMEELRTASGIVIGGGDTALYRDYIVDTEIGRIIKARYEEGVPVAGFSAGALISPEHCVISPIDNSQNEHLFLQGLGLIQHAVICAHFTFWNEEQNLLAAIARTKVPVGYGIDDTSGIYFKNEIVTATAGQVYFYYANIY